MMMAREAAGGLLKMKIEMAREKMTETLPSRLSGYFRKIVYSRTNASDMMSRVERSRIT
jgi:hypothetical protein